MSPARVGATIASTAALLLVAGCWEPRHARWDDPPPEAVLAPVDSATAVLNAAREPGVLGTVQAVAVERWTGPGHRPFEVAQRSAAPEAGHSRTFGSITLPIGLRTRAAALGQYPCTSCHQGRRVLMANERIQDAHRNVQPVHPEQTGAVCSTCHSAEDVQLLTLKSGERAALDESYRLCAQCHFGQAEAWAAGAHGKRLDGWQGRRVVMACADCHDPHNPSLQPRIPFRAPELEKARQVEP